MLKNFCSLFLCFFLAMPAATVWAEFYQYVDASGITHYTDNPSTIPSQYQSQLALRRATPDPPVKIPALQQLAENQQNLQEKKEALERRFEQLAVEKERVENSRKTLAGAGDIARYNRQAKEINLKIQEFKREEKQFITEMESYNAAIQSEPSHR